jgi:hypothetical protein
MNQKLVTCSFVMVLIVWLAGVSWGGEYHFRKTTWGMSKQEVKNSESFKPAREENLFLTYKSRVLDKDVFIVFIFAEGKLVRAKYILAEEHANKNNHIRDYKDLKKILTKKYGKSTNEDIIWSNDLYHDDYSEWGVAVSLGHLAYFSNWETNSTIVTCYLLGENYRVQCGVEYRSKTFRAMKEVQGEKKTVDDL